MIAVTTDFSAFPPSQQAIRARCYHPTGPWVEQTIEDLERSIPARFEEQVSQLAQRPAVQSPTQQLTYAELNGAANAVAHAILARVGPGGRPVAIYLKPDVTQIAAMLGVLKAGNACVVLNPQEPATRQSHILHDVQPALTVTESRFLARMAEQQPPAVPVLDVDTLDLQGTAGNPGLAISADAIARIGYTTGSTGMAKGILFTHRHLLHRSAVHANSVHLSAEDRYLRSGPTDINTVLQGLICGACMLIYDFTAEGIHGLAGWLVQREVTIMRLVPSVLRRLVPDTPRADRFPALRVISLMGDTVHRQDVDLYQRHFSSHCILMSCLGCQETQDYRVFYMDHATRIDGAVVPSGYALPDMEATLIDEGGQPVIPGEVGEIAVRSRYISPGYVNRPELTASRFLPDPDDGDRRIYLTGDLGRCAADGCLYHVGRKDFQVKLRGRRVDTGEVEELLRSHDSVEQAAVGVHTSPAGDDRLVAYIVPAGQPAPTASALRRLLAARLPDYMVPSAFVVMDDLPRTHNGKVDRKALPPPPTARPMLDSPFVAPSSPLEMSITQIWAAVLGLQAVGIHDHFLDLGGDSLLATQIMARLLQSFQVELPLHQLLQSPTVADMGAVILQSQARHLSPAELEVLLAELETRADP